MNTLLRAARLALPCLALLALSAAAATERRVALVIGNNDYKNVPKLNKAVNDANAVARELGKVGFEVIAVNNVGQRKMNQAVNEFAEKVAGGGIGVFFFAGHGLQINNVNYLVPTDMELPKGANDVDDQAVSLQRLQDKLADAKAKFSLLVIDACRDNPLPQKASRGIAATRGLAQPAAPNGQVILFSAGAHEEALDALSDNDKSPNGLFTREFLPMIGRPGLSISDALKKVRSSVIEKAKGVDHDQHPALYDQSDGDFFFVGGGAPAPAAAPAPVVQSVDKTALEREFWASIRESADPEDFQEYLAKFPNGEFAGLAGRRLKALTKSSAQVARQDAPTDSGIAELAAKAESGDPQAVALVKKNAEKGDGAAQAEYGRMLLKGRGIDKDEAAAVAWLRKAAERGDAVGQNALGWAYAHGSGGLPQDIVEAVKLYRKAAEQGNAKGQANLATAYRTGKGVAKDETEAVKWYRKAAEQGHAGAQNDLGVAYARGVGGLAKDEAEAVRWYRKAAEQGHAAAQNNLGLDYMNGRGVTKDEEEGIKWFRLAAEQDQPAAQNNLGLAYMTGKGVARDEAEAVRWYRKAAEQGSPVAQSNLGNAYEFGRGVAKDMAEAVAWYRKAAEKDNASAIGALKRLGA